MNRLFHLVALLLLALWVPATNHCALETAGLEWTAACEHEPVDASCEHDCVADMCETVENVSVAKTGESARAPLIFLELSHWAQLLSQPPPIETRIEPPRADSPDLVALHRTWSFVRRAALPVRAPAIAA